MSTKEITINLIIKVPQGWTDEDLNDMIEQMKIGRAIWDSGCIYEDGEASVSDYEEQLLVTRTNTRPLQID